MPLIGIMRRMSDTLRVARGEFSIEDPWAIPGGCDPVRLRRVIDGSVPRLSTSVAAYFDDQMLTFVFSAADDHIVATYTDHDAPLWEEDVVEVFLSPRVPSQYFEIEVNPIGATFDARIDSPEGIRETMRAELGWECDGLIAGVRRTAEQGTLMTVETLMRIPFAALGCGTPANGDSWLGNLFRVDRHPAEGDEYSAWRPTGKDPADFHVTAAFGRLVFER